MTQDHIKKALTTGLLASYAGKTQFSSINRGSFSLKSSHYQDEEIIYHDEWANNGGQELVEIGGEQFTRVYAGGVVNPEALKTLGINEADVISNLKNRLTQIGDQTRLFSDFKAENNHGWDYEYKIIDSDEQLFITVGKEIISYKNHLVFIHIFVLSPVN